MMRTDLIVAVKAFLDRVSEDSLSSATVNTWIDLVTGKLNVKLREHPRMFARKFLAVGEGNCLVPLPDDLLYLRTLRVGRRVLTQIAVTHGDMPKHTYRMRGDVAELAGPLAENTTFTMDFARALTSENWVMDLFPHVYLHGCLVEASEWLRDTPTLAPRKKQFDSDVSDLTRQGWNEQTAVAPRVVLV